MTTRTRSTQLLKKNIETTKVKSITIDLALSDLNQLIDSVTKNQNREMLIKNKLESLRGQYK